MALEVDDLLVGLQALLQSDPFFPDTVAIDAPEPTGWRTEIPGESAPLRDFCSVQRGQDNEVTRDGGSEDEWELIHPAVIAYVVTGGTADDRRRRTRDATRRIVALIAENRTLRLADAQTYAEIGETVVDASMPVKDAAGVAGLFVTVNILFVATSAAG